MPLPANLVGTSFSVDDVGVGTSIGTSPAIFTEVTPLATDLIGGVTLGGGATLTVASVGTPDTNGAQAISLRVNSANPLVNGALLSGSTIGVDLNDFAVTGTLLGVPATFYITNSPAQQPAVGATVSLAATSANIGFTPACYCAGTLIRTERGERAVERLSVGDLVVTQSGALEPIRWIGMRSYGGRFLAGHDHLLPVRFCAGSLGDGVPARDLLVSPQHAMLLDGVLIAAGLLVNGVTIVRERFAKRVDYYHIELSVHDVIWAEGAASETYIDDDNREMFHNARTFAALYPDAARATACYCAPRVTDGFAVEDVRQRLAARADLFEAAS